MGLTVPNARSNEQAFAASRRTAQEALQNSTRRVYAMVRSSIRHGQLGPGVLLDEPLLIHRLASTRTSVREALQMLANEGIVERQRRNGTRVGRVVTPIPGNRPDSAVPEFLAGSVSSKELERRLVPAVDLLRDQLDSAGDADVVMTEHLLFSDGRPFGLHSAYQRARSHEGDADHVADEEALERHPAAAYDPLVPFEQRTGERAGPITATLEAIGCDPRTAALLDIPAQSPVLLRELVVSGTDGRPRELSYTYLVGTRAALVYET